MSHLDIEAVEKAWTTVGADALFTVLESVPLLIARVRELEKAEAAAHRVGEILGPLDWGSWEDLATLAASKMTRIAELEALSSSQEQAHALRDDRAIR